jgi:putative hydrolase of the HAD superfamily
MCQKINRGDCFLLKIVNMKFTNITDVFFDLDHTLWDFDRNSRLAFKRLFKKNKVEIPFEDFITEYEPINFNYWKLFREEKVSKQQLRRGRLVDTFKRFNVIYPISFIDLLSEGYIEELPYDNFLLDGAIDILDYLKPNYKLHIITNGFSEVQQLKLVNSKIAHYFDTVTSSEEVGVKKPNPLVFEKALSKANTLAKNSIMIGDTFEADVLGAENVGMSTIFYNYRREEYVKNYIYVTTLLAIKKHL